MRAVRYTSRPAHADQLHVELWYKGNNITLDPGTYQYNAPSPWDNGLAQTFVHNTLTINEKNQMVRAGRFLWLDWAQAKVLNYQKNKIVAEHNGFKKLGLIHQRTLTRISSQKCRAEDNVFSIRRQCNQFKFTVHWLLPDWPIHVSKNICTLIAPFGKIKLQISPQIKPSISSLEIFKEGKTIANDNIEEPLLGWYSPTYQYKIPATSIVFTIIDSPPITIISDFTFS